MEASPKTVQVNIFGEEYPLRTGGDADVKYMSQVAEHVDRSMRDIAERTPNLPTTKVAILAALNITDELFAARQEAEKKLSDVQTRARGILDWLDERLEAGHQAQP